MADLCKDRAKRYIVVIKEKMGGLAGFTDIIMTPLVTGVLMWAILGDFGVFHGIGAINGKMVAKTSLSDPRVTNSMVFIHLYTSRVGLGLLGPLEIYLGMVIYAVAPSIIFIVLPIWVRRMYQRLTLQKVEW